MNNSIPPRGFHAEFFFSSNPTFFNSYTTLKTMVAIEAYFSHCLHGVSPEVPDYIGNIRIAASMHANAVVPENQATVVWGRTASCALCM